EIEACDPNNQTRIIELLKKELNEKNELLNTFKKDNPTVLDERRPSFFSKFKDSISKKSDSSNKPSPKNNGP
ncbi:MAG: hypothetical protein ACKOAD_04535, partial [Gammaproteobacteria bacterium]